MSRRKKMHILHLKSCRDHIIEQNHAGSTSCFSFIALESHVPKCASTVDQLKQKRKKKEKTCNFCCENCVHLKIAKPKAEGTGFSF